LWFGLLFGVLFLLFFVVHHAWAWCWYDGSLSHPENGTSSCSSFSSTHRRSSVPCPLLVTLVKPTGRCLPDVAPPSCDYSCIKEIRKRGFLHLNLSTKPMENLESKV
jgi:hypothetical protein